MVKIMETSVSQFKAKCLGMVARVEKEKVSILIKRHGRPAAMLQPVGRAPSRPWFGRGRETTRIKGDLLGTGEDWEADA